MAMKHIVSRVSAVTLAVFALSSAGAYDAGTTLTIPSGGTETVTDETIESFNSLAKVVFADASGLLVFNTSTPPTVEITGYGTIRKTSSADWTLETSRKDKFQGDWDFEGGEITITGTYALGGLHTSSNVFVRSGATLTLACTVNNHDRVVRLAGTGKSGRGAFRITASAGGTIRAIKLDDDATIEFDTSKASMTYNGQGDADGNNILLNDHALTIRLAGSGNNLYLTAGNVAGPGRLVLTNISGSTTCAGVWLNGVTFTDPSVEVVLNDYTALKMLGHPETNYYAKLTVEGAHCVMCHTHASDGITCTNDLEKGMWAGEVNLKNPESRLMLGAAAADYTVGITGPITGPGSLTVGNTSASGGLESYLKYGSVIVGCPTNSFGGSFAFDGSSGCALSLPYSNSVPVYANFSMTTSLTLQPNGEEHGWDSASIGRFRRELTFFGATEPVSRVVVDGSLLEDATVRFTTADMSENAPDGVVRAIDGTNGTTIELTASDGDIISPQAANRSELRITGAGSLFVTNKLHTAELVSKTGTGGRYRGTTRYCGISDLRYRGAWPWLISSTNGSTRVVLEDCRFDAGPFNLNYATWTENSIHVGMDMTRYKTGYYDHVGDLVICGDSVVTTRLQVAYYSRSRGRVLQNGGDVTVISSTNADATIQFGIGMNAEGSFGYYELAGGKLTVLGSIRIGYRGQGVFWVQGGDFKLLKHPNPGATGPWFHLSSGPGSKPYPAAHFIATGGKVYLSGANLMDRSVGTRSVFTVGGDAEVKIKASLAYGYDHARENLINLNGGCLVGESAGFFGSRYAAKNYNTASRPWAPTNVYLNANGGCIRATANNSIVLGPAYPDDLATSDGDYPITRISLYEKGLTIDVSNRVAYARREMTTPPGKGVSAIPLASPLSGVIVSPFVQIEGDGHGASAAAQVDRDTGDITNILVTSAGFGYTHATAMITTRFEGGTNGGPKGSLVDCTLADNVGGGLTVKGTTGRLEVSSTNSYAGATTIAGGTLKLVDGGYLPEGTTLVFAGGKFDAPEAKTPKKFAVDIDRVLSGGTVTNDFNTVFPVGSTIELLNADKLSEAAKKSYTLLYVKGTVTGQPEVVVPEDPDWKLRWSGDRLTLRYSRGLLMTIH